MDLDSFDKANKSADFCNQGIDICKLRLEETFRRIDKTNRVEASPETNGRIQRASATLRKLKRDTAWQRLKRKLNL